MVSFIQPAGKRALVYFRPSSSKPWQLANELPTNAVPADQAVMLRLKDVGNRTECKVEFR